MLSRLLYLFFFSGFAAIIYQIVWQRVLFTSFGTNIEAITIVVSVFMFGLGVGSLVGGYLSKMFNQKLLFLFMLIEIGIGLFGLISIPLIKYINFLTFDLAEWTLPFIIYSILFFPTMAMGATLPILVTYIYKITNSVGDSVSTLYYANTLGSAIACLVTVGIIFIFLSLSVATYIAASLNFIIAILTYLYLKKLKA